MEIPAAPGTNWWEKHGRAEASPEPRYDTARWPKREKEPGLARVRGLDLRRKIMWEDIKEYAEIALTGLFFGIGFSAGMVVFTVLSVLFLGQ